MQGTNRVLAILMSILLTFSTVLSVSAQADYIDNELLVSDAQQAMDRASLKNLLSSEEAQNKLLELGVSPEQALERIDKLSDAEVARFNAELETMPAGSGVVGIIVLFVLVFIITDIIGATDIFPFIKPVK